MAASSLLNLDEIGHFFLHIDYGLTMFCILTKPILNDLLTYWLPLCDVARLDSSLCEHVQRKQFLDLLQLDSFGKRSNLLNCNLSFLKWVAKRNVKLQVYEFALDDALVGKWESLKVALATFGESLKRVEYSKSSRYGIETIDKIILELSLQCTNLQECEFLTFSDAPMTALLARNLNMRSVTLGKTAPSKESDLLYTIACLCSNIESIDVRFNVPVLSFKCFMDSIPVRLLKLSLTSQGLSLSSLVHILSQCCKLTELRIGPCIKDSVSNVELQLVHPCLQLFRFSSRGDVSTVIPVLSTLMPHLSTLIVLSAMRDSYGLDTAENVKLILNSFRYLRQLLVDLPDGENKLSKLSTLATTIAREDKPASRRKPQLPVVGSLLEELFSEKVSEVAQTIQLPGLRSVGCKHLCFTTVLPTTLKRVILTGWHYQSDNSINKLHNLEEIELEILSGVGNEEMSLMARQNPHLRVLRVTQKLSSAYGDTMIGAAGLWTILQHCPLLHTVVYNAHRSTGSVCATEYLLQKMCLKFYPNIKHFEYCV